MINIKTNFLSRGSIHDNYLISTFYCTIWKLEATFISSLMSQKEQNMAKVNQFLLI